MIYSVTLSMFALVCVSSAQTYTTLAKFNGSNGANPGGYLELVQGIDGSLYGTTTGGGAHGHGTVFKITGQGTLTTLHSFNNTDGSVPNAGLLLATDGNFYGTTSSGGDFNDGTVYKITPAGTLTTLHSFNGTDGSRSWAALIQATDGNLYGTTTLGGTYGLGAIFRITPAGALTTLHNFDGDDGAEPIGSLIQATDGNFYGTTAYGGRPQYRGPGTVFQMTPDGTLTTLDVFSGHDGKAPSAGLVQAASGDFYGTTGYCVVPSPYACAGTVNKITVEGTLATLHRFRYDSEGDVPSALVLANDGNFYGTTGTGGPAGGGTIFSITPAGALTVLHAGESGISEGPDGLLQGTDGSFYGTTYYGGNRDEGTVFRLFAGLRPFVKTLPTSGEVSTSVIVLGTDLTGASAVTFNGTAAGFTVVSPSAISTVVPPGATTGPLQVTTPHGTLTSNVSFRVVP